MKLTESVPIIIPWLRYSWWNWLANEENRHPSAVTRPPMTPVTRVDLRLQTPTIRGERVWLTLMLRAPRNTGSRKKRAKDV